MTERLGTTPSQTVGPFLSIALPWPDGPDAAVDGRPGAIVVHGVVYDGDGDPVPDGVIETWQADPPPQQGFRGFGRACTDRDGAWWIRTLPPGPVNDQAPHLDVAVFARGLLKQLVTRIYLPDQPMNAADPLLSSLPAHERDRLIAAPDGTGRLRFDIRLQGAGETPFFEV